MEHNLTVYITADTIISSLGFGTEENMNAIRNYRSGIALQPDNRISDTAILAATIDSERLQKQSETVGLASYTRLEQLFILTIQDILSQSGVNLKESDCGLILSTTKGNIDLLSGQTEHPDERVFLGKMAQRIGDYFQTPHPVEVISNACISGVSAMIVAKRWIETGKYKQVLVAGGDVLSHFITAGFLSFKSISKNRCRPYDNARDGLNLGEACGAILLSREGTARDVVLSGGAISNDANHISGPSRTGDGLYFAMRQALNESGITPEEVSFVNTHGTATIYNDEMESKAIHLAQLQAAPVNSLKPYFGHTLGASGIVEAITCMHELKTGTLFGTLGFETPGVPMPIRVCATHRSLPMKSCVKTASGFGGCNAAIVLTLPTDALTLSAEKPEKGGCFLPVALRTSATVSVINCRLHFNEVPVGLPPTSNFAQFIREAYKNLGESNMKFYKMDDLCKLGYVAAGYLLKDKAFRPEEVGVFLANSVASLDTDSKHQTIIDREGDEAASPAVFVYTLPNVVAGEICIRHKIQGESTFFVRQEQNTEEMKQYAAIAMRKGGLKACIIGWCDFMANQYKAEFELIEQ